MKVERRYSEHGKLAHLVVVGRPGLLCGTGKSYLGAEDAERAVAAAMPLCFRCERKAAALEAES